MPSGAASVCWAGVITMERTARHVLIATDLSPSSAPLFTIASSLARPGAEVIALHVYTPEDYVEVQRETGMPIDQYLANIRAEMRYQADQAGIPPASVRFEIVEGWSVPEQILEAATRFGAALIVMATHGRTGLRRALMGSVAEEVLRHAATPVLIVPEAVLDALRTREGVQAA